MENLAINMPVLGIVGWSGSGKTTLLEALIPLLSAQGLRVNVIKHSHHDVVLEPTQKDSARMRAAGAAEVMLATPHRYAIMRELRGADEPPLEDLLTRLMPADLTLVEGYRWTTIPKIEVYRPSLGKEVRYLANANLVAVASDAPPPEGLPQGITWLDLNQPEQICAWLLEFVRSSCRAS